MATIQTLYQARIDYDYDQSLMDAENFRELEKAEAEGVRPSEPCWLFEEIEAVINEVSKEFPTVRIEDNQGGPAWNAYLILTSEHYWHVVDCAEALELRLKSFPYTRVMEE